MIDLAPFVIDVNPPAIMGWSPTLHDVEMNYIQLVLLKHDGDKPAAARELGISLKTLYNKIHQHQHMKDQWLGNKGATA